MTKDEVVRCFLSWDKGERRNSLNSSSTSDKRVGTFTVEPFVKGGRRHYRIHATGTESLAAVDETNALRASTPTEAGELLDVVMAELRNGALYPRELVERLGEDREEEIRTAMWDLIQRGRLALTPDWKVGLGSGMFNAFNAEMALSHLNRREFATANALREELRGVITEHLFQLPVDFGVEDLMDILRKNKWLRSTKKKLVVQIPMSIRPASAEEILTAVGATQEVRKRAEGLIAELGLVQKVTKSKKTRQPKKPKCEHRRGVGRHGSDKDCCVDCGEALY